MPETTTLWDGRHELVLASKSASRRALLAAAGIPFVVDNAQIDERSIECEFLAKGGLVGGLPAILARAKALDVSSRRLGALCLGADQILSLRGEVFHKARTMAEAEQNLTRLAGKKHLLTSAFVVARNGQIVHTAEDSAEMTMRPLTVAQIAVYLGCVGPDVLASVGCYQLEALGIHLFERIEGDQATILGLPMFKLLAYLRSEGALTL